jgi:hypothetical protein
MQKCNSLHNRSELVAKSISLLVRQDTGQHTSKCAKFPPHDVLLSKIAVGEKRTQCRTMKLLECRYESTSFKLSSSVCT